jgi:hypothetical protein
MHPSAHSPAEIVVVLPSPFLPCPFLTNSSLPGPLMVTRLGHVLPEKLINYFLPDPPASVPPGVDGLNSPHGFNTTNLHIHGIQVIPHLFSRMELSTRRRLSSEWARIRATTTTSKSQTISHRVNAGFAVLGIDYRSVGSSGGQVRCQVFPERQVEDVRNAVSYLRTRSQIDSNRIRAWGPSLGAGVAIMAGVLDRRIKCVACQNPRCSMVGRHSKKCADDLTWRWSVRWLRRGLAAALRYRERNNRARAWSG